MDPGTLEKQIADQKLTIAKREREMHTAIKYHADAVRTLNELEGYLKYRDHDLRKSPVT